MKTDAIQLKWVTGKNSDIHFISDQEVVFKSGPFIKMCRTDFFQEMCLHGPGGGVQCLTVDGNQNILAMSDSMGNIYIVEIDTLTMISKLTVEKPCNYSSIDFSVKDYLFTASSSADVAVTVWNWKMGFIVKSFSNYTPKYTEFSSKMYVHPYYKELVCLQHNIAIYIYEVDNFGPKTNVNQKTFYLPVYSNQDVKTYFTEKEISDITWFDKLKNESWGTHTYLLHNTPLKTVCKDMSLLEMVEFYDNLLKQERLECSCCCWLSNKDIVVVCTNGSVIYITLKEEELKFLYFSEASAQSFNQEEVITSLALHGNGIYACNKAGNVLLISDIQAWNVTRMFSLEERIVSMDFSPDFRGVSFSTQSGSIMYSSDVNDMEASVCVLVENGEDCSIVGICIVDDYFLLVAKSNGVVESKNAVNGIIVGSFHIGESLESMEGSKSSSIALVAATSGNVYILDASDMERLRIIGKENLCGESITRIYVDNYSKLAVMFSRDHKLFFINILPSKRFTVLGYITISYNVKDMFIFTKDFQSVSIVFILCETNRKYLTDESFLVTFEIPKDFETNYEKFWLSSSGVLKTEALKMEENTLDFVCSGIAVHKELGIFVVDVTHKQIRNLEMNMYNMFKQPIAIKIFDYLADLDRSKLIMSDSCEYLFASCGNGSICSWHIETSEILFSSDNGVDDVNVYTKISSEDEFIVVGTDKGEMFCLVLANTFNEENRMFSLQPSNLFCEDEKDFENFYVSKMSSEQVSEDIPWVKRVSEKSIMKEIENMKDIKQEISGIITSIQKKTEELLIKNMNLSIENQVDTDSFILDTDVQQELLTKRDNYVNSYKRKLENDVNKDLKLIEGIKKSCIKDMLEEGKVIKPLKEGRHITNYSLPKFSDEAKFYVEKSVKSKKVNECLNNLINSKEPNVKEETLNFSKTMEEAEENINGIRIHFHQDIFLLRDKAERVNYAYVLKYVVFRKMVAFNHLFWKLGGLRREIVDFIRSNNTRIKDIFKQIGEKEDVWEPEEEEESLEAGCFVTDEDVELHCTLQTDDETGRLKGIADNFLRDEWFLKTMSSNSRDDTAQKQPKEILDKLRKEIQNLFQKNEEKLVSYEKRHERLVEYKLKIDIDINILELQIYLLVLNNSNKRLFKEHETDFRNYIDEVETEMKELQVQIKDVDDEIKSAMSIKERLKKEMEEVDDDVQALSRMSRNKREFLEAYEKRPINNSEKSNLNPYQKAVKAPPLDFESLNNLNKQKPQNVPRSAWEEMCSLRERKYILEKEILQKKERVDFLTDKKQDLKLTHRKLQIENSENDGKVNELHTLILQERFEAPIFFYGSCAQVEVVYPDDLSFMNTFFVKKPLLNELNDLLSRKGNGQLEVMDKKAKVEFQIKRNQARLRKAKIEVKQARKEKEIAISIPVGKEVQNVIQNPDSFSFGNRKDHMEQCKEEEKQELEKKISSVKNNLSRIEERQENLRKGMKQRLEEIKTWKGNVTELKKIEGRK